MSTTIRVGLDERSYDIHVGADLLAQAGNLLRPFSRGRVPVVTDTNVEKLHLQKFLASLSEAGIQAHTIILPPGEATKSFSGLEKLTTALLASGVDRSGLIVALGGGVIGDLTGFAAGVLKRGVNFAQIPTTLLAQVDSSVGGKTAISVAEGKNLVGMFHQPRIVIADTVVLKTLPKRELLAGYAEVVKYGVLGDAAFFSWLEENGADALAGNATAMQKVVAHSCQMKADIVARDEREMGERAFLNLGHTFGHGLEAATGFSDRLLHGEGVAVGMALALRLSARLGYSSSIDCERLERHLHKVGLPAAIKDIPGPRPTAEVLLEYMAHDKKAKDGKLTFILTKGIGHAFTNDHVPMDTVREILNA